YRCAGGRWRARKLPPLARHAGRFLPPPWIFSPSGRELQASTRAGDQRQRAPLPAAALERNRATVRWERGSLHRGGVGVGWFRRRFTLAWAIMADWSKHRKN